MLCRLFRDLVTTIAMLLLPDWGRECEGNLPWWRGNLPWWIAFLTDVRGLCQISYGGASDVCSRKARQPFCMSSPVVRSCQTAERGDNSDDGKGDLPPLSLIVLVSVFVNTAKNAWLVFLAAIVIVQNDCSLLIRFRRMYCTTVFVFICLFVCLYAGASHRYW